MRKDLLTVLASVTICLVLCLAGCDSGDGGGSDGQGDTGGPTVSSISPTSGLLAGGTTITIAGSNFTSGATVQIGTKPATSIVVVSPTQITAETPAGNNIGSFDVVVFNNDGKSGTRTNGFTYTNQQAVAPTVSSINPTEGAASGGEPVVVLGANFQTGAQVIFVFPNNTQKQASNVVVENGGRITCNTPAGTAGDTVAVTVRNPDGQTGTITSAFKYIASGKWYRTALNSPHMGKANIWNINMLPIYPRGGFQGVWAGDKMITWGRNSSIIERDLGPLFDTTTPFSPASGQPGDAITLYGNPTQGYFDKDVKIEFKVGTTSYAVTVDSWSASQLDITVPEILPPKTAKIVATNPDGQYDIANQLFGIVRNRKAMAFTAPTLNDDRAKTAPGGFNLGEYLQVPEYTTTLTQDRWTEISTTNAPTRRNGFTMVWTGKLVIVWGGYDDQGQPEFLNSGGVYDMESDTWKPISTSGAPNGRTGHTALWTSERMFVWGGHDKTQAFGDGGLYDPATDTWVKVDVWSGFPARCYHSAILWTGSQAILWGGMDKPLVPGATSSPNLLSSGAVFTILANDVRIVTLPTPALGTLAPRFRHTAVWDSVRERMIVYGGKIDVNPNPYVETTEEEYLTVNTAAEYNPNTGIWTPLAAAATPRVFHTAVFLRPQYMVVWGGTNDYDDGAELPQPDPWINGDMYDTVAATWTPISSGVAPYNIPRFLHSAAVVPTVAPDKMIIWGGDGNARGNTGFLFTPTTATFDRATLVGNSPPRGEHTAILNPSNNTMIVWGGRDESDYAARYNHGAIYTLPSQLPPLAGEDTWTATSELTPRARCRHTAVWTGTDMLVWGGSDNTAVLIRGEIYNPVANTWTSILDTLGNTPEARDRHSAVWTGSTMVIWGGATFAGLPINTGGIYNAGAWTVTSQTGVPEARFYHSVVWTGSEMIVWGGLTGTGSTPTGTGGRYNPTANTWGTAISTGTNAPEARYDHTAVWTGTQMIIWGGRDSAKLYNTGGIYDPAINSWTATSVGADVPAGRYGHTAVWTGTQMIIWGGTDGVNRFNDGAIYDPASNSWSKITTFRAPIGRFRHTALWITNRMIVFGGFNEDFLASGGVFFPQAQRKDDAWYTFGQD